MELAGVIVAFGVLVVSGVAAAAAVVQANAAAAARRDAQTALADARKARDEVQDLARVSTAAFVRQAEAQEKANALREAETKPPAWSGPKFVSGKLFAMVNTSRRTIKVDSFVVEPDEAAGLVRVDGPMDGIYAYGDSFDFLATQAAGLRPRKLVIGWRFEDEPGSPINQFIVPL